MQKFFEQLLKFLSRWFCPKSFHIKQITMLNCNKFQRQSIQNSKDYQSQSSINRESSIRSQPLNSFPHRNQNNKTQTCKQVNLRYMKKRKQLHSPIKQFTKSVDTRRGMFSSQYNKTIQKSVSKDRKTKQLNSQKQLQYKSRGNQNKDGNKPKQQKEKKVGNKLGTSTKRQEGKKIQVIKMNNKPKPSNNMKRIEQKQPANKRQVFDIDRCTPTIKKITQTTNTFNKFIDQRDIPYSFDYEEFQNTKSSGEKLILVAQFLENHLKLLINILNGFQSKLEYLSSRKQDQNLQQKIEREEQSSNLFTCNILNQFQHNKLFLINTISEKLKKQIRRTEFLYHQDHINQTNIHRYIDGKRNIAIIIQTVDDYLVALFTEPCFQRRLQKGRGLIMSLSDRRVYQNLPDKSPIIYDQAYVIFGNSDVRIGDKQIHSQFGNPTSYYNCKGDKVDILFGSRERKDFEIKHLEIFQVIF